ncbi:unnamed protein product [Heterobilharzia americana]|nr:unnamed protein product [Heterobilharzia americana]
MYYYLTLVFLVEPRYSVVRLHCTLSSIIFLTSLQHCPQALTSSSHHLLHVTLTSDAQLDVYQLDSTRGRGV